MPVADVSVARAGGFHVLTAWGKSFAQWWLSGLRGAVPPHWLEWADGEGTPTVTVWRDGDCVACRMASPTGPVETRIPLQHFGAAALEKWLAEQGVTRQQAIVEPLVSRDLFFLRELNVPRAAFGALPNILEQEILRRTPFQLSEIWHAATIAGEEANGVVAMCHWIVRRDRAEAALSELGLTSRDVGRSFVWFAGLEVVVPFPTALGAWPVPGGEGYGFVEEKQLRIPIRGHHDAVATPELQNARDPAPAFVGAYDFPISVV